MTLKFKKLDEKATMPIRAHKGDAGLDLTAVKITTVINECGQLMLVYHTGLAVEIPEGYVGLIFPRSSIYKKSLTLTNAVGVIDSSYRGELMAVCKTTTDVIPSVYKEGERFAQLVVIPCPEFDIEETDSLSETDRGVGGFGSTDSTNNVNENSANQTEPETPETNNENQDSDSAAGVEEVTPEVVA